MTGSTVSIRLRAYRGEQHDTTECFNGLRDEAADLIDSLIADRERLRAELAECKWAINGLTERSMEIAAERDRLRELLREARGIVHAYLMMWPTSDARETLNRIDTAFGG